MYRVRNSRCSIAERPPVLRAISELESSCCTHFSLSRFVSRDFLWKQGLCSFQGLLLCLLSLGNEHEQADLKKQRSFFCM